LALDPPEIEILNVATYYHADPDAVERWPMPKYTRRQEYMLLRQELRRQANESD